MPMPDNLHTGLADITTTFFDVASVIASRNEAASIAEMTTMLENK